jgi:Fur family peroxide stress response transcriptional regulator
MIIINIQETNGRTMTDPMIRFSAMVEKLKANKQKLTPQRLAIVKILSSSDGHPSVEMIFDRLRDDFPSMSLATVYRNVLLIKSLGEALELGFSDGSNRYDGNKPYPHPHVICIKCRKIIDPSLDTLNDLSEVISKETGFRIISHRVDFFGICQDCN